MLHKAGAKIDTIYFPGGSVCSVTNVMSDGRMVEVATIGNEGVVGITVFFGGDVATSEAFVQVPNGGCQSMSADAFRRELDRRGPFHDVIGRYGQACRRSSCNLPRASRCTRWRSDAPAGSS